MLVRIRRFGGLSLMCVAGLLIQRVASERFGPFVDAPWSFTPPGIQKAKLLAFRPRVVPEIARFTRHSLPFGPSITVPGLAYLLAPPFGFGVPY